MKKKNYRTKSNGGVKSQQCRETQKNELVVLGICSFVDYSYNVHFLVWLLFNDRVTSSIEIWLISWLELCCGISKID